MFENRKTPNVESTRFIFILLPALSVKRKEEGKEEKKLHLIRECFLIKYSF